jgi:uncharacterized protein YggE
MKSYLCPMVLGLALVACGNQPDPRGLDPNETLLQVGASGRAETRPDEARFTAGFVSIAATAAAATAANNATMDRVVRAIETLGVGKDNVRTQNITLSRIDYGRDRGRYQANNMLEVRVRNVDRVGEVIAAATTAGANILTGPNLQVADQEAANQSAYANAYKAARARADAYARAAGLKVSRVLAIREAGTIDRGPWPVAVEAMARSVAAPPIAEQGPSIRAGLNVSHVQLQVDFALSG